MDAALSGDYTYNLLLIDGKPPATPSLPVFRAFLDGLSFTNSSLGETLIPATPSQDSDQPTKTYLSCPLTPKGDDAINERLSQYWNKDDYIPTRNIANPAEDISGLLRTKDVNIDVNSIFQNRASLKLANLDYLFNLTGRPPTFFHQQIPNSSFTFFDIAGGPGGFTQYLQFRNPSAKGYGVTLKYEKADSRNWRLDRLDMSRFVAFTELEGDLFKIVPSIIENFAATGKKVDLTVADGGAEDADESMTHRLILSEYYLALNILAVGGSMVTKHYTTYTQYTADLLWLVSSCFQQLYIVKPVSSRPLSTEQYVVGIGFLGIDPRVNDILKTAYVNYRKDSTSPKQLLQTDLPNKFTFWLIGRNDSLYRLREQALKNFLDVLGKTDSPVLYDQHKAEIVWAIPGNAIVDVAARGARR